MCLLNGCAVNTRQEGSCSNKYCFIQRPDDSESVPDDDDDEDDDLTQDNGSNDLQSAGEDYSDQDVCHSVY